MELFGQPLSTDKCLKEPRFFYQINANNGFSSGSLEKRHEWNGYPVTCSQLKMIHSRLPRMGEVLFSHTIYEDWCCGYAASRRKHLTHDRRSDQCLLGSPLVALHLALHQPYGIEIFGDHVFAPAILDRLLYHARLKERAADLKRNEGLHGSSTTEIEELSATPS